MRIYKTSYSYKGELQTCKTWYLDFVDHLDLKHTVPLDKSKDTADYYGRQIEDIVFARKNNKQLSNDLLKWLNEIPQDLKLKLLGWKVIDSSNLSEGSTLAKHLEAFKDKLRIGFKPKLKSGSTDLHVQQTLHRVKRIIDGCNFRFWDDIHFDKVHEFISGLGVGDLSYNYYRRDFLQFIKWMLKSKRVVTAPAGEDIPIMVVERKAKKGPLNQDEVERLLQYTESAGIRWRMTGHQRAVLYLLAVETGLRRNELSHLRPESFDLVKGLVNLEREFTKNRKEAHIPLKQCRMEPLRNYLKDFRAGQNLFDGWSLTHSAVMLQDDLRAAGIEIEGLPIDFHSMRRTYITSLDKTSATLAEREDLARHSRSYSLSLGVYTFVTPDRLRKVIEQLPEYTWPGTVDAQSRKVV